MKKCRVKLATGTWRVGQILELTKMQRQKFSAFVEEIAEAPKSPFVPDMLASAPIKAKRGRKRKVIL